jgi:YbbR domain-containing protein
MNFLTMRDLLIKDLGWKLFSLFLAVAIWLTVHRILEESNLPVASSGGSTLTYGDLPVFVVASGSDVHLYRVTPGKVSVTVEGPPDALAVLPPDQVRATVNLTDIKVPRDLQRPVDVSLPSGITLIKVDPQTVSVIVPPPT